MKYRYRDSFDIAVDFGVLILFYIVVIMCVVGAVYKIIGMFK